MTPKRNLRFALLFAWTCGGLIWSLTLLTAIAFWPAKIVRVVHVQVDTPVVKTAPVKKMEHVKGYRP